MKCWVALLCALTGCGPSIMVGRMAYFPPRPGDCAIEVLNASLETPDTFMKPNSPYELAGTVALGENGVRDPFSERYLAIVKPRACAIGGDAISLMTSQTLSSPGLINDSTSTAYVVLHKRARLGVLMLGVSHGDISGTIAPREAK